MKQIIYNKDNLKEKDITEVVTRIKVLLINNDNIIIGNADGLFQFPGGHLEKDETLEECLKREIKEETGIEIDDNEISKPFMTINYLNKDWPEKGKNRKAIIYYYAIKTNKHPDLSKTNYTENEKKHNFKLETFPLNEAIEIIENNIPNHPDNKIISRDMIEAINEYLKTKLNIADKIVNANNNIFKNKSYNITEINAGFNNDIFNVDDKYIIKVCTNPKLEDKFEKEKKFYDLNKDSIYIPKMYKYDSTKTIVPYLYEIIEKINGQTLYYHWYKISEKEREEIIQKLCDILKDIHKPEKGYDWNNYLKTKIVTNYEKVKHYFTKENQKIIENTFYKYDEYLKDNKFAFIHNDLHFDNIIVNNDKLYLIDFNDSKVAPIDYDLRILFMCKETPWKWANIEMDPYQKKEDYKNIDKYLLKYYKELNEIKYLNERILIYKIDNDMELLTRFNNEELKNNIINYSKKIGDEK